jgi:hypothetical protein
MPVCERLPTGPCPSNRNDNTVVISKGDLLLCPARDAERRRLFDEEKKVKSTRAGTIRSGSTSTPISVANERIGSAPRPNSTFVPEPVNGLIINELLTYVVHYRNKSNVDALRRVIPNSFLPVVTSEAKKVVVQHFRSMLGACSLLLAERHNSKTREAHEA